LLRTKFAQTCANVSGIAYGELNQERVKKLEETMNLEPQLHVGVGTHIGALSVFPIWTDAPSVPGLDWNPRSLIVGEMDTPDVTTLSARTAARRPTIALAGDLVTGGRQDRMLARDAVLIPGRRHEIAALCVEHGRWSGRTEHSSNGRRATPSTRFAGTGHNGVAPQDRVWNRIGHYERTRGTTNTSSLAVHLAQAPFDPSAFRMLNGQRGIVVGIGGMPVTAEIFGSVDALRRRWHGLIEAAALDAESAPPIPTTGTDARYFAERLRHSTAFEVEDLIPVSAVGALAFRSIANGIEQRAFAFPASENLLGTAPGVVLHLTAFDVQHPMLQGV
jgi:hypothetical protein